MLQTENHRLEAQSARQQQELGGSGDAGERAGMREGIDGGGFQRGEELGGPDKTTWAQSWATVIYGHGVASRHDQKDGRVARP